MVSRERTNGFQMKEKKCQFITVNGCRTVIFGDLAHSEQKIKAMNRQHAVTTKRYESNVVDFHYRVNNFDCNKETTWRMFFRR